MAVASAQVSTPPPAPPDAASPPPKSGKPVPVVSLPYRPLWDLALPAARQITTAAGARQFFVGTDTQGLLAYTLATRQPAWTAAMTPDLRPITGGDLLFVAAGDTVYALEQETGRERWRIATGALSVPPTWREGWLFTAAKDGTFAGWRVSDGARIWSQPVGAAASASIAVDGDRLFVPLADSRLVALRVEDGVTIWTTVLDEVGATPLAAGERVYLGGTNYTFYCIDQRDGRVEWEHRLIRSSVVGRPVIDEDHVWIATLNNRLNALSRGNGEITWLLNLRARPTEQIVVQGGQVIVPLASGELDVFGEWDGKPMPSPTSPVPGAPPAPGAPPGAPPGMPPAAPPSAPPAPAPPGVAGVAAALLGMVSSGTKLVPPLLIGGPPASPLLLRVTLGADDVLTVTAFERLKKFEMPFLPFPGGWIQLGPPPPAAAPTPASAPSTP